MTAKPPNAEDLGPTARQVYHIVQTALLGSSLNLERMMDADLDTSNEDRLRFLIAMIAGLNAAALQVGRSVDVLREGMAEIWERLERLEGRQ